MSANINPLSKNFNFFSLIKFSFPTIAMMIFSSLYVMVDGAFVSRLISTDALSAVNIVYPLFSMIFAIAVMIASGGSALVAKEMGEKKSRRAKADFSFIVYASIVIAIIFSSICLLFIKPLIYMLGSDDSIYKYCYDYIVPILIFSPFCMLQILFQSFFVVAGRPKIGLVTAFVGGTANVVLDWIFIGPMAMGITGASLGTIIGCLLQTLIGVIFFIKNTEGTLHFVKPAFALLPLIKSCYNGFAEMITNVSMAITTFLFNYEMLKYAGVDGVAAITIVLYAEYMLVSLFLGYSTGVAPIFSYNYGSKNTEVMKNIFKISTRFTGIASVIIFLISIPSASFLINAFAQGQSNVFDLSLHGFRLFAISFFFTGTNIFSAALFTALSNGKTAAIISLMRMLVFLSVAILCLPVLIGIDGVWLSVPVAEFLSFLVSLFFFFKYRKTYQYF